MNNKVYHQSNKQDWQTPDWIFNILDAEFGFTLDVCATDNSAKCEKYYTPEQDGLTQDWQGVCYCNPPYNELKKWAKKGYDSALQGATVVYLVPARLDTSYWWQYFLQGEIRFMKGRLSFLNGETAAKYTAPFPTAFIVFYPYLPKNKKQVLWVDYRAMKNKSYPSQKSFFDLLESNNRENIVSEYP